MNALFNFTTKCIFDPIVSSKLCALECLMASVIILLALTLAVSNGDRVSKITTVKGSRPKCISSIGIS